MPETITKDGEEIEVYTKEELEAQSQSELDKYKEENPGDETLKTSLEEKEAALLVKEEELEKEKGKEKNFAKLREKAKIREIAKINHKAGYLRCLINSSLYEVRLFYNGLLFPTHISKKALLHLL